MSNQVSWSIFSLKTSIDSDAHSKKTGLHHMRTFLRTLKLIKDPQSLFRKRPHFRTLRVSIHTTQTTLATSRTEHRNLLLGQSKTDLEHTLSRPLVKNYRIIRQNFWCKRYNCHYQQHISDQGSWKQSKAIQDRTRVTRNPFEKSQKIPICQILGSRICTLSPCKNKRNRSKCLTMKSVDFVNGVKLTQTLELMLLIVLVSWTEIHVPLY